MVVVFVVCVIEVGVCFFEGCGVIVIEMVGGVVVGVVIECGMICMWCVICVVGVISFWLFDGVGIWLL